MRLTTNDGLWDEVVRLVGLVLKRTDRFYNKQTNKQASNLQDSDHVWLGQT